MWYAGSRGSVEQRAEATSRGNAERRWPYTGCFMVILKSGDYTLYREESRATRLGLGETKVLGRICSRSCLRRPGQLEDLPPIDTSSTQPNPQGLYCFGSLTPSDLSQQALSY